MEDQTNETTPKHATTSALKQWIYASATRAIKTAAQAAISIIPVSAVTIGNIDWLLVAGASALAAVISLLTSVAGIPEVSDGSSLKQITENK